MGVRINPELCGCEKTKKPCKRAVIDRKKEPLRVRKISAERGLYSWDLAQLRYPRRRDFKDLKIIENMKWIDLAFTTVAAKEEFIAEFRCMEDLRNQDNNEFEKDFQERRRLSHKPGKSARK